MLNSISRSVLYKLVLALFFVVLFGAGVPALRAQSQWLASRVGPADEQVVAAEPEVSFSQATYSVNEGTASAEIEVILSAAYTDIVEVDYASSGGTATAGSDYTEVGDTLTFAIGETNQSFNVPIINDAVDEADETINLTLSNPVSATLGTPSSVMLTILDDDTAGFVIDPTALEISESSGSGSFDISLTSEPLSLVSIGFTSLDTSECVVSPTGVSFNKNNWSSPKTVTVEAVDDGVVDGDQTCTVETTASSGDTNYDTQDPPDVSVTVTDDDSTSVQFSGSSYTVGEGSGSAVITVTLTSPSLSPVTVTYDTSDGTATVVDGDYTATSDTLVFDPNQTSKTFTVPITDDGIDEDSETVNLALSAPEGAGLGTPNTATLNIFDNDLPPTVQFTMSSYSVTEGEGSRAIQVELSAVSEKDITVGYLTTDGTATGGSDYQVVSDTLTISAGASGGSFIVPIVDDASNEPPETVNLTLRNPANATLGTRDTATLVIVDNNDPEPTAQLSSSSYSVSEVDGAATITATLSAPSGYEVEVDYATSNGTALAGSDYTPASDTLTFLPGEEIKAFNVPIIDDTTDEPLEAFTVSLSNPNSRVTLGTPSSADVSIVDDDGPTTVQFNPVTFSVNEGLTATISVALSAPSGQTVTVDYATSNGSATAGSDYVAANGTLTFAPGEVNKTFPVPTLSDQVIEGDETVNLTLSKPINAQLGAPNDKAVLTITDPGEATVQFSQANFNVPETALTGELTVTLSAPSALTVTVNYTMTNGTATTGDDYAPAGGTLIFGPGQVRRPIVVSLLPDELDEADETVLLVLSAPVNATLGVPASGTLTILDDDLPPSVQFAAASQSASEADGTTNLTVQLSAASGRTVTVGYATVDGTAKAGNDYSVISGTLVFNPGERSKIISVPIIDDDVDEPNESFVVALSNPVNARLGTPGTVTVTIFDSDLPIFTRYFPAMFYEFVVGEPNDTCGTAYPITAGRPYSFLPDDQHDWYQFDLATSGNLVVEVTNFVPLKGQVAVYRGANCGSVTFLGNYGLDGTTKRVSLGLQTAGHYYVYVSNDGVLNDTAPYQLYVRFP